MNSSQRHWLIGVPALEPAILGAACCAFAALGYAVVNICLRQLALTCNSMWVICVKESVSVVVVGPWLLYGVWRGMNVLPSLRPLATLALVGLATQLAGNVIVFWAFGIIGLAVTIPIVMGVNLAASAALSRMLLGERVSIRSGMAIGLLIAAVAVLSLGAGAANQAIAARADGAGSPLQVALAVGAACLAGVVYSFLSVAIRSSVTNAVSPSVVVFMITAMGVVSLGPLSLWRLGTAELLHTRPVDLATMLTAGFLNLLAFAAITKGLQLTTVVHANVINASQTAIAALAGMLLFAEPPNPALILGVCLTIAGMILLGNPTNGQEAVSKGQDGKTGRGRTPVQSHPGTDC